MRLHLSVLPAFLALYLGSPALSLVGSPPPAQASAGAVSAGFSHVCTLGGDGAASCWGTNTYGQLGDGG
ncbi:MAG: RCC1 domain-containing protein, partial [Gammaproteobacteria bacterium]|nr:RCC1 domain-containing protein [Gammaproteobacteria bacterium]